jgi:hypothetical protein
MAMMTPVMDRTLARRRGERRTLLEGAADLVALRHHDRGSRVEQRSDARPRLGSLVDQVNRTDRSRHAMTKVARHRRIPAHEEQDADDQHGDEPGHDHEWTHARFLAGGEFVVGRGSVAVNDFELRGGRIVLHRSSPVAGLRPVVEQKIRSVLYVLSIH